MSARAEERGGEPSANRGAGPGGDPVGELRRRLSDLPGYVRAVLLFGSLARGEAGERSDVDLLVLHSGAPARDPVERRRLLYKLVAERLEGAFEAFTLVDMDLERFLKPETVTPSC